MCQSSSHHLGPPPERSSRIQSPHSASPSRTCRRYQPRSLTSVCHPILDPLDPLTSTRLQPLLVNMARASSHTYLHAQPPQICDKVSAGHSLQTGSQKFQTANRHSDTVHRLCSKTYECNCLYHCAWSRGTGTIDPACPLYSPKFCGYIVTPSITLALERMTSSCLRHASTYLRSPVSSNAFPKPAIPRYTVFRVLRSPPRGPW